MHGVGAPAPRGEPPVVTEPVRDERDNQLHELLAARNFLLAVANSMGEGLFTVDMEGRLTFMNAAAERMLGWTLAELIGRDMHDATHFERADGTLLPSSHCALLNVGDDGPVHARDEVFITKEGRRLPVACTASWLVMGGPKGSVVVFSEVPPGAPTAAAGEAESDEQAWVERIHDALSGEGFTLHAQPLMRLSDRSTASHELLVRLKSPSGEVYLPGRFMAAAAEHGLSERIDQWVVSRCLELITDGHDISFNLSPQSMTETMLSFMADALALTGATPSRLTCEITETALLQADSGEQFVRRLRELGVRVALDDFGAGYESFAYLKDLLVSFLKIDMQFVRNLLDNPASRHVVETVVKLGADFGIETVAEGVEDPRVLDVLASLGVDYAQGFAVGWPVPVEYLATGMFGALG